MARHKLFGRSLRVVSDSSDSLRVETTDGESMAVVDKDLTKQLAKFLAARTDSINDIAQTLAAALAALIMVNRNFAEHEVSRGRDPHGALVDNERMIALALEAYNAELFGEIEP